MHKIGCPQRNNHYAHCECEAMDLREHTEQLQKFNENVSVIGSIIDEQRAEIEKLRADNSALLVVARAAMEVKRREWRDNPGKLWNDLDNALESLKQKGILP